jgi:hypothetical protein
MRWSQPLTDGHDEDGRLIADRELVVSRGCRAGSPTMVSDCITEGTKTPPERLSPGAASCRPARLTLLLQMTQLWASASGRRFPAQTAQIGGYFAFPDTRAVQSVTGEAAPGRAVGWPA